MCSVGVIEFVFIFTLGIAFTVLVAVLATVFIPCKNESHVFEENERIYQAFKKAFDKEGVEG